jgi:hypothetical protein
MDEDDPEKRIAELERQLAEHERIAEPSSLLDRGVDSSDRSAAHRCFVATAPRINMKVDGPAGGGEVYPMNGATLGRWATADILLGTALHLRNARHRFVLGGQSYSP